VAHKSGDGEELTNLGHVDNGLMRNAPAGVGAAARRHLSSPPRRGRPAPRGLRRLNRSGNSAREARPSVVARRRCFRPMALIILMDSTLWRRLIRRCVAAIRRRQLIAIGSCRMRLPVAAKIALHSAGAIGGRPRSPTPPSGTDQSDVGTRCTLIWRGAASMRVTDTDGNCPARHALLERDLAEGRQTHAHHTRLPAASGCGPG